MIKKFLAFLFIASVANSAGPMYEKTDVLSGNTITLINKTIDCNNNTCLNIPSGSLPQPLSIGTSLIPTVLNSYNINATVTANSLTFVCNTGCSQLRVGQGISNSTDGTNLLYPSIASQFGALITNVGTGLNGATVTTSQVSNPSLTPGTYTMAIGKNRWDTNSTAIVNTLGAGHIWSGAATSGNSTWAQGYLASDCDDPLAVTNCSLMTGGGALLVNNMSGARTSDTSRTAVEGNISLGVNDDTVGHKDLWNNYWETILLAGAGTGHITHALESTVYNFNSASQLVTPYNFNQGTTIENLRLSSGQAGLGTMYNASDAISILPIAGIGYEVGILFANGAIDTSQLTNPPAIAFPVNDALVWYRSGQTYGQPTWSIFSSNSTRNANTMDMQDRAAVFSLNTDTGTPTTSITPGGFTTAGNYTSVNGFGTTGSGIDMAASIIKDAVIANNGTVPQTIVHHIGQPTLTTLGTGVNLTTADTLAIDNCPAAGTNVTITNCYALRVLAGGSRFDGLVSTGALTSIGTVILNNTGSSTTTIGAGSSTSSVTLGNSAGTGSSVVVNGPLTMNFGTAISKASWGTTGVGIIGAASTFDDSTVGSGGVTTDAAYGIAGATITNAEGTSNTLTNLYNLYVGAPVCGSGWTACTNTYGLFTAGRLGGSAGLTVTGGTINMNVNSGSNSVNIGTGTSSGTVTLGQNSASPGSVSILGPASFNAGTAYSAASWTTTSPVWNGAAMTLNDTTASGTVANDVAYSLQAPNFTSTGGASTTITTVSNLYVTAPTCSGGVVCTNLFAINTPGNLRAGGSVTASAGATITGGNVVVNNSGSTTTTIGAGSSSGNVTIGNASNTTTAAGPFTASSATVKLSGLATSSASQTGTVCSGTGGLLTVDTTTTCLLSSIRWKEHIESLDIGIDEILKLHPVSYDLKPEFNPANLGRQVGLIAEDVQKVDDRLVGIGSDGLPNGVRYQQLTAVLIKGEQELQAEVQSLIEQNAMLKARVEQLEAR